MCTFEKNEKNQAVITVTVSGEEFERQLSRLITRRQDGMP